MDHTSGGHTKKDGQGTLCGDYNVTLNSTLDVHQYPLPCSDDLFATLAGEKHFSILDLLNAYQQLPLEDASRKFITINTHRGPKPVKATSSWSGNKKLFIIICTPPKSINEYICEMQSTRMCAVYTFEELML